MAVPNVEDLDLASADREWDSDAAERRVRSWAHAEDKPNAIYRDTHLWYDEKKPDNFGSYKLPFVDVVDGKLKAVPHAVHAAGNVLEGGRGGVNIPKDDIPRIKTHLAKFYRKMHETPPWESGDARQ